MLQMPNIILLLILAQIATAFVFNESLIEDYESKLKEKKLNGIETRRRARGRGEPKERSTSSDSKHRESEDEIDNGSESLDDTSSSNDSTDDDEKEKDQSPKSTVERKGWRKWHRKCTKCPEDMKKKWRDPSIRWICGAYQQARRSFKSLCMMHMRNCQDGTMFTKIADHRCKNGSDDIRPYNLHFFYDYTVELSGESSVKTVSSESETHSSSSISESELEKHMPPFNFHEKRLFA